MSFTIEHLGILNNQLKEVVFNQEDAINAITKELKCSLFSIKKEKAPRAILFFLGPSYSGKKFATLQMSCLLKSGYKIFHMEEYLLHEDADKLCNSNKKSGEISTFVHQNPFSIIVFDEIDKAHNNVQTCLARYLIEDNEDINLSECVIIFTSNLGKACYLSQDPYMKTTKDLAMSENFLFDLLSDELKYIDEQTMPVFSLPLLKFIFENGALSFFKKRTFTTLQKLTLNRLKLTKDTFEKKENLTILINDFEKITTLLLLSSTENFNTQLVINKTVKLFIELIIQVLTNDNKKYKNICFLIGEEANKTHNEICIDLNLTIKKMEHLNERLSLTWFFKESDSNLNITLNAATFHQMKKNNVFQRPTPIIEYASSGFEAVAGQHVVKQTLREIIRLINHPNLLQPFNIKPPNGMLLYGPKGIGKTILAEAFSFEANIPFIRICGIDLFDPEKVRSTYILAKEYAPCVVILDELDQKGMLSSIPFNKISSYFNLEGVLTIATARELEDIPPEFMVPEALDMMIELRELDKEARKFFIEKIFKMPHEDKIDIDKVATYMTGMNGQDLKRISSQTALSALIQRSEIITEELLIEQINKIKYGEKIELKRIKNPKEEMIMTAYHEAGHAVLSIMLLPQIVIEQVTVAPRSEALGFVSYKDEDFITTATKDEIFKNLCVLMAGRVIKLKKFGPGGIDSGDITDIGQATLEAYAAIAHLGMDEELGYINILSLSETIASSFLKEKIESRVSFWLNEAKNKTEELVEKYWDIIEIVAQKLVAKEMLSGDELARIVHNVQIKIDIQTDIYPFQSKL